MWLNYESVHYLPTSNIGHDIYKIIVIFKCNFGAFRVKLDEWMESWSKRKVDAENLWNFPFWNFLCIAQFKPDFTIFKTWITQKGLKFQEN